MSKKISSLDTHTPKYRSSLAISRKVPKTFTNAISNRGKRGLCRWFCLFFNNIIRNGMAIYQIQYFRRKKRLCGGPRAKKLESQFINSYNIIKKSQGTDPN